MSSIAQSAWPIVQVDNAQFNQLLALFKDLRTINAPVVRNMQPRICLQCWMVIGLEDAPDHKGHNQTSDFAQMEEANRPSFLQLCKQYDRLTADCKQVILMKVQPKIIQAVEQIKKLGKTNNVAKKKPNNQIQEVDLTNAISPQKLNNKKVNGNVVGAKRPNNIQESNFEANKRQNVTNNNVQYTGIPVASASGQQPNFPEMFNQFMMNAMQQNMLQSNNNKGKKNGTLPQKGPLFFGDSPQQEQFQIKILEMVKKVQKKCEQISSEVRSVKSVLQTIGFKNVNGAPNMNSTTATDTTQKSNSQSEIEKQKVIDLDEEEKEDPLQKGVEAELQKIREENKEKTGNSVAVAEDGENLSGEIENKEGTQEVIAQEKPQDEAAEAAAAEPAEVGDTKMTENSPQNAEEVQKQPEEPPVIQNENSEKAPIVENENQDVIIENKEVAEIASPEKPEQQEVTDVVESPVAQETQVVPQGGQSSLQNDQSIEEAAPIAADVVETQKTTESPEKQQSQFGGQEEQPPIPAVVIPEKSAEETEQEKQELLDKRQKMLMDLANDAGNEQIDDQNGLDWDNDEGDKANPKDFELQKPSEGANDNTLTDVRISKQNESEQPMTAVVPEQPPTISQQVQPASVVEEEPKVNSQAKTQDPDHVSENFDKDQNIDKYSNQQVNGDNDDQSPVMQPMNEAEEYQQPASKVHEIDLETFSAGRRSVPNQKQTDLTTQEASKPIDVAVVMTSGGATQVINPETEKPVQELIQPAAMPIDEKRIQSEEIVQKQNQEIIV